MISIEETLKRSDLPADLVPHLVFSEVLEGARKPRAFIEAVREDVSLIGAKGTKISIPIMSQLSARTETSEDTKDASDYTVDDVTMTDVDVNVDVYIYSAIRLSKILLEDQPDIDWVRLHLRNMGLAIAEKIDADIRDALVTGASQSYDCSGSFDGSKVLEAMKLLDSTSNLWTTEGEGNKPILFVRPEEFYELMADSTYKAYFETFKTGVDFVETKFCTIRKAYFTGYAKALLVAPPTHSFGATTMLAWKRRPDLESDEEILRARTLYVTSARYGVDVIQSAGIVLLSNC